MIDRTQFDGWRNLVVGQVAELHPNPEDAMSGYFRLPRSKGAPPDRVAIWRDETWTEGTHPTCVWGDLIVNVERVWPFCARYPVSFAAFEHHQKTGTWPDQDASATASAGLGHNSGAVTDEEQIKSQIEAASAGVKNYAIITDADHLARAQTLRSRLLELHREAKKHRDALSKPHNDALKDIRAVWTPLVDDAQDGADRINRAQENYATKLWREREAAEKSLAEDRAALEARGIRVPEFAAPPPLPSKIKGASGRAASMGTRTAVKSVTDWPALFLYFQSDDGIQTALLKLANKFVGDGHAVPGVETEVVGRVK